MLYISKDLKFQFREALGVRANNFAELYALTLLLLVTVEKKLKVLQVFGDTKVIIYWITWETVAQPFFLEYNQLKLNLEKVSFALIFKEQNG